MNSEPKRSFIMYILLSFIRSYIYFVIIGPQLLNFDPPFYPPPILWPETEKHTWTLKGDVFEKTKPKFPYVSLSLSPFVLRSKTSFCPSFRLSYGLTIGDLRKVEQMLPVYLSGKHSRTRDPSLGQEDGGWPLWIRWSVEARSQRVNILPKVLTWNLWEKRSKKVCVSTLS